MMCWVDEVAYFRLADQKFQQRAKLMQVMHPTMRYALFYEFKSKKHISSLLLSLVLK